IKICQSYRKGCQVVENNSEIVQEFDLHQSLEAEQMEIFRTLFLSMHPYDQAQFFMKQEQNKRFYIYYYLSPEEVAQIMENIDLDYTTDYFLEMDPRFASSVFAQMPADDAVDILNELDKDKVASY